MNKKNVSEEKNFYRFILIFMFMIICGAIAINLTTTYYSEQTQTFLLMREAIKTKPSIDFTLDCEFDEINTFLNGYFEHISIPTYYGTTEESGNETAIWRNRTESNYVGERFDINGFKGLRCKILGGVNK